jgi:hypothetical protein
MTDINISQSIYDCEKSLAALSVGLREQAVPIALNDMAKQTRTQASRIIRNTWNIKVATIKKSLYLTFATPSSLRARITATMPNLPAIAFTHSQNKIGVALTIKKGIKKTLKHAFIATMPSGHEGVFERVGKGRLPIKEVYTKGPGGAFATRVVQAALADLIRSKFTQILEGKCQYLLKRQRVQEERDAGF